MNYLYDEEFLIELTKRNERTIYALITAFTLDDQPIESLQGEVTQGSINLDGTSAVRRSCSLTLVSKDINISDYYWSLKTKFQLQIGLENNVSTSTFYPNYPDIIWFDMGRYVITSFSTSLAANSFSISIQGKDKMALLNGDLSGNINAKTDFGTVDEEDEDGNIVNNKIPIKDIIIGLVHTYGREPLYNIIIKDLDQCGLELLEYRGSNPLYILRKTTDTEYSKILLEKPSNIEDDFIYDNLFSLEDMTYKPSTLEFNGEYYYCAKIEYGRTAGYRTCELVYAGDLIANPGDTIVSVLDKIKNMLGNFEYFYDTNGQFIFRKQPNYLNTVWNPIKQDGDGVKYVEDYNYASLHSYDFVNNELIISFNNNPNINNIKNDFTVRGTRKGATGADIPIFMRYAIDNKPKYYVSFARTHKDKNKTLCLDNQYVIYCVNKQYIPDSIYYTESFIENNELIYGNIRSLTKINFDYENCIKEVDWREIIYQMALDYDKYHLKDMYQYELSLRNLETCNNGKTGYEQYYIDLQGFWRQLYKEENEKAAYEVINNPKDYDIGELYTNLCIISLDEKIINETYQNTIDFSKLIVFTNNNIQYYVDLINYTKGSYYIKEKIGTKEIYTPINEYNKQLTPIIKANLYYGNTSKKKVFTCKNGILYFKEEKIKKDIYYIEDNISSFYPIDTEDNVIKNFFYNGTSYKTLYEIYYTDQTGALTNIVESNNIIYYVGKELEKERWNKSIIDYPESLNFWFDFLEPTIDFEKFSVRTIGDRTKVVNQNNVKAIYYRDTPKIIYTTKGKSFDADRINGYSYLTIPENYYSMFNISSQGLSAKNQIDELLYQSTSENHSVTITTVPIYYLLLNSRIYLYDEATHINGEYNATKMTIPLTYNGTMQITATKVPENSIHEREE